MTPGEAATLTILGCVCAFACMAIPPRNRVTLAIFGTLAVSGILLGLVILFMLQASAAPHQ